MRKSAWYVCGSMKYESWCCVVADIATGTPHHANLYERALMKYCGSEI